MTDTPPIDEVAYEPDSAFAEGSNVRQFMRQYDIDSYEELIARTTGTVDGVPASGIDWFWDVVIDELDIEFYRDYDAVRDDARGPQFTEWYPGGTINAVHNVLDRHATDETAEELACIWEGEPGEVRRVTFAELARETNRVANLLEDRGVGVGDTVGLYLPMIPEVISILYGCLSVGAIAVPVFSGFGREATATRIDDSECTVLFTADGFYRRGSQIPLKSTADQAIEQAGHVEHMIVYDRLGSRGTDTDGSDRSSAPDAEHGLDLSWAEGRDEWWTEAVQSMPDEYATTELPAEQPSMLLYSSGTTGRPKGIVHTHAGALVQAAKEIYFSFDHQSDDRFFWVSDIGWMMGPWMLLGNHTFGGTVFMYEGAPDHPDPDRFWAMIDRHDLTVFGVSPTAIRALREHGDEWLDDHDLSSLRILGSTGEPWDPESWQWFLEAVGGGECPIMNISGGTEIMGCFLQPMPIQPLKPCTLGGPGLGMDVDVVNADGESIVDTHERGYLVARDSCPSMTKSLWSGDERYLEEYWSTWPDVWDHGDWARVDEDDFWFLEGRADDVLNVAGRRVGPAEVEGALVGHAAVTQAVAVGVPDATTGTAVVAYVILQPDTTATDELREQLRERVGAELGKPFRPQEVLFVDDLPKTQSGKLVRRAVAKVHRGEDVGDTSSIENPAAIERLGDAR